MMRPNPDTMQFVTLWLMDGARCHDVSDARWRRLTEAGNRAFSGGDAGGALRHYEAALIEAERLFDQALAGGAPHLAPMTHTIACQNAAEAKRQLGDAAGADDLIVHAVETLISTAETAGAPLALRINCLRHLHPAFAALKDGLPEDARRRQKEALVARACSVSDEVLQTAERVVKHAQGAETKAERSGLN